jgi:hypothetical protein
MDRKPKAAGKDPAQDPQAVEAPAAQPAAATQPATHGPLRVICKVATGRWRAGRRWAAGETPVDADALTAEQIGQLRADVMFDVIDAAAA